LIADIATLTALSNENDGRFIHDGGARQRAGMASHPNSLDERWVDPLVDGNLVEKESDPFATFIRDRHLVSSGHS
jgi:hypothetical protein